MQYQGKILAFPSYFTSKILILMEKKVENTNK